MVASRLRPAAVTAALMLTGMVFLFSPAPAFAVPLQQDCTDDKGNPVACTDTPEPPKDTATKEPAPTDTKVVPPTETPKPTVLGATATSSATLKPTVLGATATLTPTASATFALGELVGPIPIPGGWGFVTPGVVEFADERPTVVISEPARYGRVVAGEILLRAQVTDDVALAGFNVYLNGARIRQEVFTISDARLSYTLEERIPAASLWARRTNVVRLQAWDSLGQTGEDWTAFWFEPAPGFDLELVKIEVTQGIQCLDNAMCPDNSIPQYVNKPTLVRAYLRLAGGTPPANPLLTARVCLAPEERLCWSQTARFTPLAVADPVAAFRGDYNGTFNINLPAVPFLNRTGDVSYTVHVNDLGGPVTPLPEFSYANNSRTVQVRFRDAERWEVVFIPVNANGRTTSWGSLGDIARVVQQIYPMAPERLWYRLGFPIYGDYDFGHTSWLTDLVGCQHGWIDLEIALAVRRYDPFGSGFHIGLLNYYGMVGEDGFNVRPSGTIGCGLIPGAVAGGVVYPGNSQLGGMIAAHELGHNHGRNHAPGCGAAASDGRYPRPDGALDEFGVDLLRRVVHRPDASTDIMGYCGNEATRWVSTYTYRALQRPAGSTRIGPGLAEQTAPTLRWLQDPENAVLLGAGIIAPQGVELLSGFYHAPYRGAIPNAMPDGPYSLELEDGSGKVLSTSGFAPITMSNSSGGDAGAFILAVPWSDAARAVVFRYRGEEIARRAASLGVPTVTLLSPNGGEAWGASGSAAVRWSASDPDGDPLSFVVQVSSDRGETWQTITDRYPGTELNLDLEYFPGANAALVRVIATDGLNSGLDVSDGPFHVEEKAPFVAIVNPENGGAEVEGSPLQFTGMATDIEDGPLTDPASFVWSSSLDGPLGVGPQLLVDSLSPGDHTITLVVPDSSGRIGTASAGISIVSELSLDETPSEPQVTSAWPVVAGIGLLLAAGVLVMILVFRRRRTA